MKSATLIEHNETLFLTHLEFFNWGGFNGLHSTEIDLGGTAVIGPTGSGKTTLVDALMTLLCATPRYNLASTGGHESDRDLVSYVRGVSGPGDGGQDQTHIARPGKTVTAISARFANNDRAVRVGGILWFEGTSSSASDMKKLWLFAEAPEHTLDHWLTLHHEGGMRSLRQMEKDGTGIWTYPSKKGYLARLRDYFDVGENAFTLLNRAAGLKQLNSIDDIFRELVLDNHAAFSRAQEVADSFDDLTDIHEELEIARRQQRALIPVAEGWEDYQHKEAALQQSQLIKQVLPVWYAEQAHRIWKQREAELNQQLQDATALEEQLSAQSEDERTVAETHRQAYLEAGGANIEQLQARIEDWKQTRLRCAKHVQDYQSLVSKLGLPDELTEQGLQANQHAASVQQEQLQVSLHDASESAFSAGIDEREAKEAEGHLRRELREVLNRPGSNLPPQFQQFRAELAQHLGCEEQHLPFVAELVQVKEDQHQWRGAIERAIGSHRLRILVAPENMQRALKWINQRHNRLHVRLLEVKNPARQPVFFDDGFTRKLDFKDHPYREALKTLLANIDRHCVNEPEELATTPHAMTPQGLMSGKARHFDKQDQRRLDQDWMTGFDNRDRLAALEQRIIDAEANWRDAQQQLQTARNRVTELQAQDTLLQRLQELEFSQMDLPGAEGILANLSEQLAVLTDPKSDLASVKVALEKAVTAVQRLDREHRKATEERVRIQQDLKQSSNQRERYFRRSEVGLTNAQRELGDQHLPQLRSQQRDEVEDLERQASNDLQNRIDQQTKDLNRSAQNLTRKMSDAKAVDRGALTEVGRDLEDVPAFLERLHVLTEEALPDKLKRFLEYLNRSSDEGVTQLLGHIDNEVSMIEERIEDLNHTLSRVDFQPGRYLRLVSKKVIHESLRTLQRAQRQLNSSRFTDDSGESQYKALQYMVSLLRDACERSRTQGAKALLDPRYRLEFAVSVIDRSTGAVIETRTGSQGGSGGEKEIIASYVLTASLSYALCPDGSSRPLFGTIVLDEAFSRSSHAVAGRIIAALREFGLHAVFITPNKEMRLLRNHTRSAIVVHRRGLESSLTSLSWQALDEIHKKRLESSA